MFCESYRFLELDDEYIEDDRYDCENDNFYDLVNVSIRTIQTQFFLNSCRVLWI